MNEPLRKLRVRRNLAGIVKEKLVEFLKANLDLFAWSHEDMVGIDPSVMCHHLNIDPKARPVRKKRRALDPKRDAALKEEVDKLKGKWRTCVDFTQYGYPTQF